MERITPCLWFNDQGEEAAKFYVSVFPNSEITAISRYGDVGQEHHGRPPGSVMTVEFVLDGLRFTALNGGPTFVLTEAVSLQVWCDTQEELDHYWDTLSDGGPAESQICGWLKDRYGLSWQIVPTALREWMRNPTVGSRVMGALLQMGKLDIAALQAAARG